MAPVLPPGQTASPTGCNECRTGCLFITDFVLVDADQNLNLQDPPADYLYTIQENDEISLVSWLDDVLSKRSYDVFPLSLIPYFCDPATPQ